MDTRTPEGLAALRRAQAEEEAERRPRPRVVATPAPRKHSRYPWLRPVCPACGHKLTRT